MTPILHHYDISNFSEKVRLAFGLKGLAWRSVIIPATLPKPDYEPLAGGYRRTPALQIGADIYCDTRLILAELERRRPEPTLYPGGRGHHEALATWAEGRLIWPAARWVTGRNAEALPDGFHADRAAMLGRPEPTPAQLRAAGERALGQLRPQRPWVVELCEAARPFLLGDRPGLADLSLYIVLWFLRRFPRDLLAELALGRATDAWMARVAALGHGARSEMEPAEALDVAMASEPVPVEPGDPLDGFVPGDRVAVAPEERTSPPVDGLLARIDAETVVLMREHPRVGRTQIHFPRLGYSLRRA